MKKGILFLVFLCLAGQGVTQSRADRKAASQLLEQAEELIQAGNYEQASRLLYRAKTLDKQRYEIGLHLGESLYLQKDYTKAAKVFKGSINDKKADPRLYQLYGNCLDFMGKSKGAMGIYKKGLQRFPDSGLLCMEAGLTEYSEGFYEEALVWWEKGIEVQARFPSNYYWAALSVFRLQKYDLALLYGETFMNLERGSERTEEISELLAETYKAAFQGEKEGHYSFNLRPKEEFESVSWSLEGRFQDAFDSIPFVGESDSLNLETLVSVRLTFLGKWQKEHQKIAKLDIFDWLERIREEGHFEAYTYWLMGDGFGEEAVRFYEDRADLYEPFEAWFQRNSFLRF